MLGEIVGTIVLIVIGVKVLIYLGKWLGCGVYSV